MRGTIRAPMRPLRLLFATPYVPSPLRTRPYGFVRFLARRGHRIALLAAHSSAAELDDAAELRQLCESVTLVRVPLVRSLWNCARGLGGDLPLQALFAQSPALRAALRAELASGGGFDLVHVEHLRAALLGLEAEGVPRVFDAVDCISSLFERAAAGGPSLASRAIARLDLERTRRFEARLLRDFDATLVSSEADRRALVELPPGGDAGEGTLAAPTVIANGVDLDYFRPSDAAGDGAEIVFAGRMSYHANVAAAVHLVEEIMPLVWRERPQARVALVGAEPNARVRRLGRGDPRVAVTGRVADIRPFLARARVAACPLPYAAGIQNKVLEAMACGTPVVASSPACAALAARDGETLLRADGAAATAAAILRLLGDEALRRGLAAGGRAYVAAAHDWNSVVGSLEELYQDVLARRRRRGGAEGSRGQI